MTAPLTDIVFEALANGLWRGALLALAVALVLRLCHKRTTAGERYAVWLAVLMVVALAPGVEVAVRGMQPVTPAIAADFAPLPADFVLPGSSSPEIERAWQPWELVAAPFVMLWLAVGGFFVVRLGRRCSLSASLKQGARRPGPGLAAVLGGWERTLNATRKGSTRLTASLRSPVAVGWLDPAVLLPEGVETDVESGDLEMLWRHEQAHVSRLDDWTQLVAEVCFALAWFHPGAYWARRELERERELACDEAVLDAGVEADRYAGALGRWAERAATGGLPAGVMGLGRSRAQIIRRIEMLLSPSRTLRRNGGRRAFGVGLAVAFAAAGLLIGLGPVAIRAQSVDLAKTVEVEPTEQPEVQFELATPYEVKLDVPVRVIVPPVQVEPVMLSQVAVPAPPVAPVPPSPAPAPSAVRAPPVPPAPPVKRDAEFREQAQAMREQAERWRKAMQPHLDEIQREARRIQEEVQAQMGPQREKIQALAKAIAEEHSKSIQPLAQDMAKLGAQMAEATAAQREELAAKMEAIAKQMEAKQPELRRLEEEMSKIQVDMKPFEQRMKVLEEGLREKEKALREAQGLWEKENGLREPQGLLEKEEALRERGR